MLRSPRQRRWRNRARLRNRKWATIDWVKTVDWQNLKEGCCVVIWYPRGEMPRGLTGAARGGHGVGYTPPSPPPPPTPPHPRSQVYTHDPPPAHHSAASPASVPAAHLEAVGITPPEPGTLFNDMSGQNVTALYEKARGWKCFKPRAGVGCVLTCIWACVFVPPHVSERTLTCKLQAKEWKSGILKALGK